MEDTSGDRCIHCDRDTFAGGGADSPQNSVMVRDSQINVILTGNTPREQEFETLISANEEHHVGIVYDADNMCVDLYFNYQLKQRNWYTESPGAKMNQGFLGCWFDTRDLAGYVRMLSITHSYPHYRATKLSCSFASCPYAEGLVMKHDPYQLQCRNDFHCGDEDKNTCCDPLKKCLDPGINFVCGMGYIMNPNAANIYCTDVNCVTTPVTICCLARAYCSTKTCAPLTTLKSDAATLLCELDVCSEADQNTCCQDNAPCTELANSAPCPTGKRPKLSEEEIFCKGFQCTAADWAQCCETEGLCIEYDCSQNHTSNMVHIATAREKLCKDKICKNQPPEHCCSFQGKCATYHCPAGTVHKADATSGEDGFDCLDTDCTPNEEHNTLCCSATQTCNNFDCEAYTGY
jgi:hypothetical protein